MPVTLRELSNANIAYKPGDPERIYPDDWNLLRAAVSTGEEGILTAGVWINGEEVIDGSRTGTFVELIPDADNTRKLGTSSLRWQQVHAGVFYGSAAGLTGIPVGSHASSHSENQSDEIFVENLGALSTNTAHALKPDGTGGVVFGAPPVAAHASTHEDGGSDEVSIDLLPTEKVVDYGRIRPDGSGGLEWIDGTHRNQISWRMAPDANGAINWMGFYEQTNTAASLASGSPVTAGAPAYHSHWALNVSSAVGAPFTLRITGRSIDDSTGVETPADTEDIAVSGNGWYQSTKSWLDAVSFSIVEATKSCTLDAYRVGYWHNCKQDFDITGICLQWLPGAPAWSIRVKIDEVQSDGQLSNIDDFTFASTDTVPRATNGSSGRHTRGDYATSIDAVNDGGVVVWIDQVGIDDFYLQLNYEPTPVVI